MQDAYTFDHTGKGSFGMRFSYHEIMFITVEGSISSAPTLADVRGCYPMPWGEWANGEYDLGGSLLRWGRWRGDARALEVGLALVRHQRDFDRALGPMVKVRTDTTLDDEKQKALSSA